MKSILYLIIGLISIATSCQNHDLNDNLTLNYTAQTRGFIYSLILEKNTLEFNNNNSIKKISLTKNQQLEVFNLFTEINFEELENNISINDLAVDKAISGLFKTTFKDEEYKYEFNHNNLPKAIIELFQKLEDYTE